jgi:hypothetical protein
MTDSWFTTRSCNTGLGGSAGRDDAPSFFDSRGSVTGGSGAGKLAGAVATDAAGEGASAGSGVVRGTVGCGRAGFDVAARDGVGSRGVAEPAGAGAGAAASGVGAGASGDGTGSTVAVVSVGAIGDEAATGV